ncbi:MAG: hypothetical protein ABFR05_00215 [Bacteroidota bacterium]
MDSIISNKDQNLEVEISSDGLTYSFIFKANTELTAPKGSFIYEKNKVTDELIDFLYNNNIDALLDDLKKAKSSLENQLKLQKEDVSEHDRIPKVKVQAERFENLINLLKVFNRFKNFTPTVNE